MFFSSIHVHVPQPCYSPLIVLMIQFLATHPSKLCQASTRLGMCGSFVACIIYRKPWSSSLGHTTRVHELDSSFLPGVSLITSSSPVTYLPKYPTPPTPHTTTAHLNIQHTPKQFSNYHSFSHIPK